MTEKFRPCPFCGCDIAGMHTDDCYFSALKRAKKAIADDCDFSGISDVLDAWNRRFEPNVRELLRRERERCAKRCLNLTLAELKREPAEVAAARAIRALPDTEVE